MRTPFVVALVTALALSATAFVAATSADCEDGQNDKISQITAPGRPTAGACEGEQWDGEDTTGATESGDVTLWYLDPNGRIDRAGVGYRSTSGMDSRPDVNNNGPADAAHVRVIGQGSPGWKEGTYNVGDGTLYVMVDVWGVAQTGVSASGHQDLAPCIADGSSLCSPNVGPGPDGALVGTAEVAWYGEDNTDQSFGATGLTPTFDSAYNVAHNAVHGTTHGTTGGNVLASAVHFVHITQGNDVNEENPDCSQATYDGGTCTRDNTAATVELLA